MTTTIDYDHSQNRHTASGPRAALPSILEGLSVRSLLDVGCGTGTWLKAAQELGITDLVGVDAVAIPPDRLLVSPSIIRRQDLTLAWKLDRQFDLVLCLEVAEHLDAPFAGVLLDALVAHAPLVMFSAASPNQAGQHHVNLQWPAYWQKLFNQRGYVCADGIRQRIWEDERIEPWYRQNIFVARRDPERAGQEPRIPSLIHPGMYRMMADMELERKVNEIERGQLHYSWYLKSPLKALWNKLRGTSP